MNRPIEGSAMKDLKGKTAVITGAASGIGKALAAELGAAGMKLALADTQQERLAATAKEFEAEGFEVLAVPTDVSKAGSMVNLADEVYARFGSADLVCNNAGVMAGDTTWSLSESDYKWLIDVNIWGVVHGVRTFVPRMLESGRPGHIVNTASMAAVTTMPFAGAYHLTKHAVLALSECLYFELQQQGSPIGVSVLCPELVKTGLGDCRELQAQAPAAETEAGAFVVEALRDGLSRGVEPSLMAQRVLDAVQNDRFYILSDDVWMDVARGRMQDIASGVNPVFRAPV